MQQPDFSDLKENSLEEMTNFQNQEEMQRLTQIEKDLNLLKDVQNEIDLLVQNNEESLDAAQDKVQKSAIIINQTKESADKALDDTLNLRSNVITIVLSGLFGVLSFVNGFGATIGTVVGELIGRNVGEASQGNIKEKASD